MNTDPTPRNPRAARSALFRSIFAVTCGLLLSVAAFAADALKKSFDVPAGDAIATLKQFMAQADAKLLYSVDAVKDVKTNAVKGEHAPREALEQMLDGTGLQVTQGAKDGTLAIARAVSPNVERAIAQTEKSDRPDAERPCGRYETDEQGNKVLKLDTFEVFGRKTLNMDIQRTRDDVQPYVVFDRQTLENSGASSLEDFLKNRLPMATQSGSADQAPVSPGPSFNGGINLRGLGTGQTLILVDGRRLTRIATINTNALSDVSQPMLRGVPMSAVDRVEVLPSTAGGIYGGGATGGVINIILRRNYRSFDFEIDHGSTFDTDAGKTRFGLNGGLTLNDGATRVGLMISRERGRALFLSDRDFAQRSGEILLRNAPTQLNTYFSVLPNVISTTGAALVLDPSLGGTPLGSPRTFVPSGYAGFDPASGGDSGAALRANAGRLSLDPLPGQSRIYLESRLDALLAGPGTDAVEAAPQLVEAFIKFVRRSGQAAYAESVSAKYSSNPNPAVRDAVRRAEEALEKARKAKERENPKSS